MAGTTRWVVLDGSSTAFEFSGSWREEAASGVHQTTLQTTTLSGSQMSFRFNGSEMILFGEVKTGDDGVRPRVDCSVDNVPTSPDARATGEDFACWWPTSQDDGPHDFLLNATIPSESGASSVSIDSLWFHPAFDSSISDKDMLVMYDNQDPHIQFSPGDWDILEDPEDNGVSSTTNQTGASLSVIFTGTKIVWEGWRAAGSGLGRSNGTFSMDGGPPTSFDINPSSSQQTTKGITVIEVGDLAPGPHNLTVVYNGPSAPLILDHFLVTGGNFRIEGPLESVLPSTSSSPAAPTSSSDSSASPGSSSPPVGAIAGGVVGGVVALLLIILVILWTRRRSRNRTALPSLSTNEATSPTPFTGTYSSSHQGFGSPGVTSTSHLSPSIRTSTNGTSLTQINNNNSPAMYRKGLESSQQPETMGEVYQYQDSGVRLPQNGLPPVYTPD